MKITIDVQPLLGKKSGVGYYIWGLLHGLAAIDKQNQYNLAFFDFRRRSSLVPVPAPNFKIKKSVIPGRLASLAWKKMNWPPYHYFFGFSDIYHFPNFIIRPLSKGKKIATIHDVSFKRYGQFTEPKNLAFLNAKIEETLRTADELIVDSQFTKDELLHFYRIAPDKVHVVHLGLDERFKPVQSTKTSKMRILFIGTVEPRKNLESLFRAFEWMMDHHKSLDCELVIAGMRGWLYENIFKCMESHRYRDRIKYLDYVNDHDLPALYQSASAFVYPSFYEGFGLPPLEAMASGIPVIAARGGSLPEVLGEAPYWIDPGDVSSMAEAMEKVLTSATLRNSLIRKGSHQAHQYTWGKAAQQTITVYERCKG